MSLTASEIKQITLTAGAGTATGTNTYAVVITEVKAYVINLQITVKFTNANTGASTLNINGLGVVNIYKNVATPLVSGDFTANSIQYLTFDGTNFQVSLGAALPSGASMVITTNSSGVAQTIYSIVDAINTTPEATLLALDWSSGTVTYTGTGGQKILGASYEFTCVYANTWRRSIYNMIYADLILAVVSDSGAVFTSAQMANLYPNAVPGNRARGNAGSYEYWGSIGWKYTVWTS